MGLGSPVSDIKMEIKAKEWWENIIHIYWNSDKCIRHESYQYILHLSIHLSSYLSTYLPSYLPFYLPSHLPSYLLSYLLSYISIYLSNIYLCIEWLTPTQQTNRMTDLPTYITIPIFLSSNKTNLANQPLHTYLYRSTYWATKSTDQPQDPPDYTCISSYQATKSTAWPTHLP